MVEIGYSMEELIPVVAELAGKYTGYDSTSITYEKAQQLMEAVIFCIREYEGGCEEASSAVGEESSVAGEASSAAGEASSAVREASSIARKASPKIRENGKKSAKEAYQLGYQRVIEMARAARELYHSILLGFRHYGNQAYRDTILEEMPEFFRRYDTRFEPQSLPVFLEYPLMASLEGFEGIDRIACYLYCVHLEQKFLAGLPEGYAGQALSSCCEDYRELPVNLPEIILKDMQSRAKASGNDASLSELVNEMVDRAYGGDEALKAYLLRQDMPALHWKFARK